MSKTVLKTIRLVNWYGFTNCEIPVCEHLTLISGENECGKSTILDAVIFAYTGDTQFNKASTGPNSRSDKRNLFSYTRCLTDPSSGIYARPADRIPVVYSHIMLEYEDQVNERPFILGVIIETAISEVRGTYWYALDRKTLREISPVYEGKEGLQPYDASGFQKAYGVPLKNRKDGIALFMQMTGLRLPSQEVPAYRRKLRNIMAYNPAAKIQDFIKESVLEAHDVNLDKLREAKKNIEQIHQSLEQIQLELKDLDDILGDFSEHDQKELQLKVDDIKQIYQSLLTDRDQYGQCMELIRKNEIICTELGKEIQQQNLLIEEEEGYLAEARNALRQMDVSKAIAASEEAIRKYEIRLTGLEEEKKELEIFQLRLSDLLPMLENLNARLPEPDLHDSLTSRNVDISHKQHYVDTLKEAITGCRDQLLKENALLSERLKEVQQECIRLQRVIENCKKNRQDYSEASLQLELISRINRELGKKEMEPSARLACEYVSDLTDESWREALEAYLGKHRYAIIVDPEAFDLAESVLDRSRYREIELVNVKLLYEEEPENDENSVFRFMTIPHETASRYFCSLLGKVRAVKPREVSSYALALSMDGKVSRHNTVSWLDFSRIGSFCLGQEAVRRNLRLASENLAKAEDMEKELTGRLFDLQKSSEQLKAVLSEFQPFNMNAHREAAAVEQELYEEKTHLQELLDAMRSNEEFMALSQRVRELTDHLQERRQIRDKKLQEKTVLETKSQAKAQEAAALDEKIEQENQQLEEERMLHTQAAERAMSEYDAFLAGTGRTGVMTRGNRERVDRRVRELEGNILGKQQSYNNRKQEVDRLPTGLHEEAAYQKRRGRIWIDDLQGIQGKLKEQTISYERIFKREFVLSIYEIARDARRDIKEINKELRKLRFSTRYQFDVKLLNDSSDFTRILSYAEYLQKTNDMGDGQMSLMGMMEYGNEEIDSMEEQIREIINRIIEKNDSSEIKRFADYRNYMSYEIIINNDEIHDGKLSRQAGYNSGAGTQIPYTLILSAALSMLYNARVNSVRLIFMDEPFEKMSDHNIRLMLEFFRDQDFQVIFCAPPNKLESIGSECGVIIPVLKQTKDNMQVGKVIFRNDF